LDNRAEADAGAQSYEVAFALDQPADLPLVPGMQLTVRLRPAAKDSLLGIPVVPLAALASFAERRRGFYVWRVDRATNTVRAQPVSLGLPTGEGVLVLAGLEAGDEVVVAGVTHLAEGMRIAPRDRL
jgi:multidrug efflux pump subunit AcrA (membrane-fusion protein)